MIGDVKGGKPRVVRSGRTYAIEFSTDCVDCGTTDTQRRVSVRSRVTILVLK